jgi:hypothetical protein
MSGGTGFVESILNQHPEDQPEYMYPVVPLKEYLYWVRARNQYVCPSVKVGVVQVPAVPEVVHADGLPEPADGSVVFGSYLYTSKFGRRVDCEPSADFGAAVSVGVLSEMATAVARVEAQARFGLDIFTPVGVLGLDTKVTDSVGL